MESSEGKHVHTNAPTTYLVALNSKGQRRRVLRNVNVLCGVQVPGFAHFAFARRRQLSEGNVVGEAASALDTVVQASDLLPSVDNVTLHDIRGHIVQGDESSPAGVDRRNGDVIVFSGEDDTVYRSDHRGAFPDNANARRVLAAGGGGVPAALALHGAGANAAVGHVFGEIAPNGAVYKAKNAIPTNLERLDIFQQLLNERPKILQRIDDVDAQAVKEGEEIEIENRSGRKVARKESEPQTWRERERD